MAERLIVVLRKEIIEKVTNQLNKGIPFMESNTETSQKIKVSRNGPYIVVGRIPISVQTITCDQEGTSIGWRKEKQYPLGERCALCRCGKSGNKPFCDGSHEKNGFDGTEKAGKETYLNSPKEIDGPKLKLTDIEELCASARFCHRAGGIWQLVPESSDPKVKKIITEEAYDCPSGRLVLTEKETQKRLEPDIEKSIWLIEDPWAGVKGPIWVRGYIPVESTEGRRYALRNRLTLCRCGKSSNKPFCDSSHYPEAETIERMHNEMARSIQNLDKI